MVSLTRITPPPTALAARVARARALLREHYGYPGFRSAQEPVVRSVLAGRDTLAVLPTGGGKSVCFQMPALVIPGYTLVISPLISLMQDQVAAAAARGIPAEALNSTLSPARQRAVMEALGAGELKLLYTSPERLATLAPRLAASGHRPALLAIDEAHCIAEWGHDFRPSYRTLRRARRALGWPRAVALTGSATPEVRADIARALGLGAPGGYDLHLGSFDRRNLWFGVVRVRNDRERWTALLRLLREDDRVAIVYAPTRNIVESLARKLTQAGYLAAPYHAGLTKERRSQTLVEFLADRVEVVVATCAFGMGIDKPNVRLVVHWTMPPTPESYYQEAGRAGRDGALARCILLHQATDPRLPRAQLDVTFPDERLLERVWSGPEGRRGVPAPVLASADRLARELHPERGEVDWRPVRERRRRAADRIAEVDAYARDPGCRRRRILAYFGEELGRCAGCDHCGEARRDPPLDAAARRRLARLRLALTRHQAPWGGALLHPATLRALAVDPPQTPADLADQAGVGPRLAARLGGLILTALWAGAPVRPFGVSGGRTESAAREALARWRESVAEAQAIPPWQVASDRLLHEIVAAAPVDRSALARLEGVGPRFLNKYAEAILAALNPEPVPATP